MSTEYHEEPKGGAAFTATSWTLVRNLHGDEADKKIALEKLCAIYWTPLYFFVRRQGLSPENASDIVQDLMAKIVRTDLFSKADKTRGRLRTFLLSAMQEQVIDWRRHGSAAKRGGGQQVLSLQQDAESLYGLEPVDDDSPDKIFARKWVAVIFSDVISEVEGIWNRDGNGGYFAALKLFIEEELDASSADEIGKQFGQTAGNVRVRLTRLKKQFRALVRARISDTIENSNDPNELEDELRELNIRL